jgi:rubrerythrin
MDEFDLDRYLRVSKKVDLRGVEWDRVRDYPLRPAEARCLAYMMDIETHTVIFLRDLLATRAANEPDVTAFLSCWVYEELWHGEAFSRFLGEAGYELGPDGERVFGDSPFPSRYARNSRIRELLGSKGYWSHIGSMVGSKFLKDFVAVHMTWGAANELSTLQSYQRLIATTEHPILVQLLQAIIKDERRHFAFYRSQARMRLARSKQARTVVRWALQHMWAIVGTGVRPQSETDHVVLSLFGGVDGLAAVKEIDGIISALPGLGGLTIYQDARRGSFERYRSSLAASSNVTAIPGRRRDRPSAMPFAALRG